MEDMTKEEIIEKCSGKTIVHVESINSLTRMYLRLMLDTGTIITVSLEKEANSILEII